MTLRPTLKTFRVAAYSSENRTQGVGEACEINFENTIEIGVAIPTVAGSPIMAVVKLILQASAHEAQNTQAIASFRGEYQGNFQCPDDTTESDATAWIADDDHQYLLAAQAFPLAMSHFRRELQSTGFDARNLPLGI
jgi:hypothetical protein